jgi:hypothetical protein
MYGLLQLYPALQKEYKANDPIVKTIPFTHAINCIVHTSETICVNLGLLSIKSRTIVLRNVTKDWTQHLSF